MFQQLALTSVFFSVFLFTSARHTGIPWGNEQNDKTSPLPDRTLWLYQGDIMLSEDQADMLEVPDKDEKISPNRAYTAGKDEKRIWYDGIIPYAIDCSLKNMPGLVAIIKGAMKVWESRTCVRFVERDQEDDYLTIFRGTHCYSTVGRAKGNRALSVGHGCEHHHVMLHELGHVIGLWHEQSRPDRDKYIRVLWRNIIKGWEFAFVKLKWKAADTMRLPYDYSSIMHYPFTAFSKDFRKRTIIPLYPVRARPYERLTELDIMRANLLYNCPDSHKRSHSDEDHQSSVAANRRKRRSTRRSKRSADGRCENKLRSCKYWASLGFCKKRQDFMLTDCKKSCNVCSKDNIITQRPGFTIVAITHATPLVQHGKSVITLDDRKRLRTQTKIIIRKQLKKIKKRRNSFCRDSVRSCVHWASKGFCRTRTDFMLKHCQKSCDTCNPVELGCVDRDPRCQSWARWRWCTRYKYKTRMITFCARSCGHCKSGAKACHDRDKTRCAEWKNNGYCDSEDKDIREAVKKMCRKTCNACARGESNRPTAEPPCVDLFKTCYGWYRLGYCVSRPSYMDRHCRKSCGVCTTRDAHRSDRCLDNEVGCEERKAQGYCEKQQSYMQLNCRKTCKMCTPRKSDKQARPPCKNKNSWCKRWAQYGYCHTKTLYMIKYCKQACGICKNSSAGARRLPCTNRQRSCNYWASIGVCDVRPDFMYRECRLACRVCTPVVKESPHRKCKNKAGNENCDHWAKLGKCAKRANYMIKNCQHSCNACPSKPLKLVPAKPRGILCQLSCKPWLDRGMCFKRKNRCQRTCLAKGCDEKPARPAGTCSKPFGAGWDYGLPDSAFSASSALDKGSWDFSARNARLYKEDDPVYKRIGGWCSKEKNSEWLQVDLGKVRIITAVATQGRDKFFEHVKSYTLGLSNDGKKFFKYREKGKLKIMQGNCDHFTPAVNSLHKAHAARFVRFYPVTFSNICMRVEIYGCNKLEGQARKDYPHVIHPRYYYN